MSDLQLKDEIMTIFLAGHETTSNALTWTFYLLSQHPTAEARLYAELCSVLGDKDAKRIPTVEDIPKLKYTEKVFRESMRLYPPAWTIGLQAINDYKVDKYVIPAGSMILMSQYRMHHCAGYFYNLYIFYTDRRAIEAILHFLMFNYILCTSVMRDCVD